jgi:hypothetical protein
LADRKIGLEARERERERERERTQSGFCNERKGEWRETGKFHFVDATFSTKLQLEK